MDNNDNINILSIPKGKKLILEKININDFPEYKKRLKKHFEEPSNYFNDDLGNKKIINKKTSWFNVTDKL